VASRYGHQYFVGRATSHSEPAELYEELGAAGFLGVHLPEEYGGLSREYGLADLWFLARMLRTAPTSREMVLNFVAQHSLGLPASY
jgi:alkylation response protein AidB-like acyl-CoA dehydrogenase